MSSLGYGSCSSFAQCPPPHNHCLGSCAQALSLTWILTCMWGPAPWPQKKSVARGLKVGAGEGRQNFTRITGEWSKPALPHAHCPMEGTHHTAPHQHMYTAHGRCTPPHAHCPIQGALPQLVQLSVAPEKIRSKMYAGTEGDFASFFYSGKQMLIIQICKPIVMLSP